MCMDDDNIVFNGLVLSSDGDRTLRVRRSSFRRYVSTCAYSFRAHARTHAMLCLFAQACVCIEPQHTTRRTDFSRHFC